VMLQVFMYQTAIWRLWQCERVKMAITLSVIVTPLFYSDFGIIKFSFRLITQRKSPNHKNVTFLVLIFKPGAGSAVGMHLVY